MTSAAISVEVAEQRAQEMAALNRTERECLLVFGVLSGVVVDGRGRFGVPPARQHRGIYRADCGVTPPRCA